MSFSMLRLPASRAVSMAGVSSTRMLSTRCTESVERLRQALEEYRVQNYAQEIPSRFRKEVVKAAQFQDNNNRIAPEGLERVLLNIGMSNRLMENDMEIIFSELGEESGAIPVHKFVQNVL